MARLTRLCAFLRHGWWAFRAGWGDGWLLRSPIAVSPRRAYLAGKHTGERASNLLVGNGWKRDAQVGLTRRRD